MAASLRVLIDRASPRIVLGSKSHARRQILDEIAAEHGFTYTVQTADIDEKAIRYDDPQELVTALAKAKHLQAAALRARGGGDAGGGGPTLLITGDQVVVHEGLIREKPESEEEARQFIAGYSRSPPRTVGSVVVTNLSTGYSCLGVDTAEMYFHPIPEEVVSSLLEEGTVYQCAGGLMIEHPLVSPLVESVMGTMDSIMGLPKALVERLLVEALEEHLG